MKDKNIRILILEDRTTDAALINYELTEAGFKFTPIWVVNEKEFLRALDESSPDLILCDYNLPQYNGALALAEAKMRYPEVPFILVTGALYKDPQKIGEILARGASDYVLKDRLDQLAPAVQAWVARKESAHPLPRKTPDLRSPPPVTPIGRRKRHILKIF